MFKVGDKAKILNPDIETQDELLEPKTVNLLKELNFIGTVTQVEDELTYVGFAHENLGWVTQVFKEDEIEVVQ